MPAEEEKDAAEKIQSKVDEQSAEQGEGDAEAGDLNFAEMDLSVESVEERISPSETNVFDK